MTTTEPPLRPVTPPSRVTVVDFDMPFRSMVGFILKRGHRRDSGDDRAGRDRRHQLRSRGRSVCGHGRDKFRVTTRLARLGSHWFFASCDAPSDQERMADHQRRQCDMGKLFAVRHRTFREYRFTAKQLTDRRGRIGVQRRRRTGRREGREPRRVDGLPVTTESTGAHLSASMHDRCSSSVSCCVARPQNRPRIGRYVQKY